jgi:hypothetical protein
MTPIEAAAMYVNRGFLPLPVPFRKKAPNLAGWPEFRVTAAELPRYFEGETNIGLILGDNYGTADVDLDSQEALAAAAEILPKTAMVFGRPSKPASHYMYRSDPAVRSKRYFDPIDKTCLVELRCRKAEGSVGVQTIVPPSVHPDGEQIRFEPGGDGEAYNVDAAVLEAAVAKIAAAAVLARHWPAEKAGRNQAFIALAGALARGGWPLNHAVGLHRAIYRALWGAQANLEACEAEVRATFQKHEDGLPTTGKTRLEDLIDRRAVRAALSWVGISQPSAQLTPCARVPQSMTLEDLMDDNTITIPELIVEGFLPKRGLILLGGRPKDGKSWFACQLALSFCTGQPLGDWLEIRSRGRVHLWALEDQFALTKEKLAKLLGGKRPVGVGDVRVFSELSQPILRGGDEIIQAALREHPAELIILDSLFKLTGATQSNYDISQRDYDVIDRVRSIALGHGCAAVIVMHTKKGARGGNPIENILGTSGTSAAADGVAELKRFGNKGKLTVVGRTIPHENFDLVWRDGPEGWGWTIESQGDGTMGETSEDVVAFLEAQGPTKPAAIAAMLHKSYGAIWMALQRLQDRGRVIRLNDKRWELVRKRQ